MNNEKSNQIVLKLAEAMNNKKSISFKYIKRGKTKELRYGNPHAIFVYGKEGITMVHILQYAGASDTAREDWLPLWRMFYLENIVEIEILNKKPFKVDRTYNPNWQGYDKSLYKFDVDKDTKMMRCF